MKTLEICASYSGAINCGNYENRNPMVSIKKIYTDIDTDEVKDLEEIEQEAFELQSIAKKLWLDEYSKINTSPARMIDAPDFMDAHGRTQARCALIKDMLMEMAGRNEKVAVEIYRKYIPDNTKLSDLHWRKVIDLQAKVVVDHHKFKKGEMI